MSLKSNRNFDNVRTTTSGREEDYIDGAQSVSSNEITDYEDDVKHYHHGTVMLPTNGSDDDEDEFVNSIDDDAPLIRGQERGECNF